MSVRLAAALAALAITLALAACGGDDSSGTLDGSTRDGSTAGMDGSVPGTDGGPRPDNYRPFGDLPAFPGAEGFGSDTPGGRGGRVYVVTTLDWDGPGSFREAITATEPRIIVFAVSGVIDVPEGASLDESMSFVTVAGQTSPGGITFTGSYGSVIEAYHAGFHDGVFRFLRFRGRGSYDNISLNEVHHVVIDHCDFSGGTDETFDMTYSNDFTVQWSTISNSDTSGQNYGSLIAYPPTANISLHHNLNAHHGGRCAPHMHWGDGVEQDLVIDYRNNVVYNCAFDGLMYLDSPPGSERISFNVVGNYAKAGPDTPASAYFFGLASGSTLYESDNAFPDHELWSPFRTHVMSAAPVAAPPVTTQPSSEAFDLVVRRAGAFPRDAMNTRVADEVTNGTGTLGRIDDALLMGGAAAPADADMDGMSDAWESAHGLDPSDAGDASTDRDGDGYTNVEEYVNELAAMLVPA